MNPFRVLLVGAACVISAKVGATVLHFEDVLFATEYRNTYEMWGLGPEIYSEGFVLRYAPAPNEPYPTEFSVQGPLWRYNYLDTIAISPNSCSARVTLSSQDNNPFHLFAIDLQESNGADWGPVSVTFTGMTANQQVVSHSATLNQSSAWETVRFPATFRHLQYVVWYQGDCITNKPHMFDNIHVVPTHKAP